MFLNSSVCVLPGALQVLKAMEKGMEENPGGPWMTAREIADYLVTQGFAMPSRHAALSVRDFVRRVSNKGKFCDREVFNYAVADGSRRRAIQWTLCSLVKDTVWDATNSSGVKHAQ